MIKFGTGGFRAVIGEDFTRKNIELISKALVTKIYDEGVADTPIAIGYDRRFLSREAMYWAGQVFASNGIKVKMIDSSSPTPLLMYYVMSKGYNYGLMITASHNPAIYNGIKVITKEGRDASEEVTKDIEKRILLLENDDTTKPILDFDELVSKNMIKLMNPINEYLDSILDKIDVEAIRKAHLKIAIDPLYGVSLRSLNTIFSICRCDVRMIHTEHDTLFAGKMPAPDENTVRSLQNYVTDYNFDLGIATDGDADRIGLIDDKGRYINANEILCILYYYFLEYKGLKTDVVRNLATTTVLDKIAKKYNRKCYEVPVGLKYISAKMKETGAYIGGESSGGLTVMGHINGKDAIYASALLVETIAKTGKKLSELLEEVRNEFGYYKTIECNLKFKESRKEELIIRIYKNHDIPDFDIPIESVNFLDGCKINFKESGWLLIRFSGTEPLLRIFSEMPIEKISLANELCEKVRKYYGI